MHRAVNGMKERVERIEVMVSKIDATQDDSAQRMARVEERLMHMRERIAHLYETVERRKVSRTTNN